MPSKGRRDTGLYLHILTLGDLGRREGALARTQEHHVSGLGHLSTPSGRPVTCIPGSATPGRHPECRAVLGGVGLAFNRGCVFLQALWGPGLQRGAELSLGGSGPTEGLRLWIPRPFPVCTAEPLHTESSQLSAVVTAVSSSIPPCH